MLIENPQERKPAFSASVGVIPLYEDQGVVGIVLGLRKEDELWTPIAGGIEGGEDALEALGREWQEKTGLDPQRSLRVFPYSFTTVSPREGKTSVGITHLGLYAGPPLPYNPGRGEISTLELFPPQRLRGLLEKPEGALFRPDLNLGNLTATLTLLSPNDGVRTILLTRARQSTNNFLREDTYI